MVKPLIFGFVIATVGCYEGLRVKGGTQGVGRATTSAVVISSVTVIVLDAFLLPHLALRIQHLGSRFAALPFLRLENRAVERSSFHL